MARIDRLVDEVGFVTALLHVAGRALSHLGHAAALHDLVLYTQPVRARYVPMPEGRSAWSFDLQSLESTINRPHEPYGPGFRRVPTKSGLRAGLCFVLACARASNMFSAAPGYGSKFALWLPLRCCNALFAVFLQAVLRKEMVGQQSNEPLGEGRNRS